MLFSRKHSLQSLHRSWDVVAMVVEIMAASGLPSYEEIRGFVLTALESFLRTLVYTVYIYI